MFVNYVSFEVPVDRQPAFEEWFSGVAERSRRQKGCIAYDYLVDPFDETRCCTVEVWQTSQDHGAHCADPDYDEMLARGSSEFGMADLRVRNWRDAEGYSETIWHRTDDLLIRNRQDEARS
jgi:quinol monooxygenase YgiN